MLVVTEMSDQPADQERLQRSLWGSGGPRGESFTIKTSARTFILIKAIPRGFLIWSYSPSAAFLDCY